MKKENGTKMSRNRRVPRRGLPTAPWCHQEEQANELMNVDACVVSNPARARRHGDKDLVSPSPKWICKYALRLI